MLTLEMVKLLERRLRRRQIVAPNDAVLRISLCGRGFRLSEDESAVHEDDEAVQAGFVSWTLWMLAL
jgi:hypothetical protein